MVATDENANVVPLEHRPYLLIARLARALSHQIRTPLNVISNDLIYFKRFIEDDECQRGIKRCEQITRLLQTLNLLGNSEGPLILLDLKGLIAAIADKHALSFDTSTSEGAIQVLGNGLQLTKAYDYLLQLLKQHSWLDKQQSAILSLDESLSSEGVVLTVRKSLSELFTTPPQSSSTDSLAELFSSLLSSQSILPPLLDAIFWNHRVQTQWSVNSIELKIEFSFPLSGA